MSAPLPRGFIRLTTGERVHMLPAAFLHVSHDPIARVTWVRLMDKDAAYVAVDESFAEVQAAMFWALEERA